MKTAVIIITDPQSGTDEANGRLFNALSLAQEAKEAGDEVAIVFVGAGTRWPGELSKLGNPFHGLYNLVRDKVVGASCACAAVFGATESVQACGIPTLKQNPIPTTAGLASVRHFLAEGWQTLVF